MDCPEVLKRLKSLADRRNVEGMARFGICSKGTLGVSMPNLRSLAKKLGKSHSLALELWGSGIHEARILAGLVDESEKVTERQMEKWVADFDSWDVCDQVCMNLFDRTEFAWKKAREWSARKEEFEKRAGFAMMAVLAVHDKRAGDGEFVKLLPLIKKEADDERNFVKKAVNWALRQIGKRNANLRREAIKAAREIEKMDSKSAKWVAADALREFEKRKG